MNNFKDMVGMNIQKNIAELNFPINRKDLITDEGFLTGSDVIIHEDPDVGNTEIGIIPRNRPIYPYVDVQEWLNKEFSQFDCEYKLIVSTLLKNYDYYQVYVFDMPIGVYDVDELSILPMMIVRGSYIRSPLQIEFGTYHCSCAGGVKINETIEKIRVKPKSGLDFLYTSLKDQFQNIFLCYSKDVPEKHQWMKDSEFEKNLYSLCKNGALAVTYKKPLMEALEKAGIVKILVDKMKKEDFIIDPDLIFTIEHPISNWEFYVLLIKIFTHKARSLMAMDRLYSFISELFSI